MFDGNFVPRGDRVMSFGITTLEKVDLAGSLLLSSFDSKGYLYCHVVLIQTFVMLF
jgi:hypothetical protein